MPNFRIPGLAVIGAALLLMVMGAAPAMAQHATGGLIAPPEVTAKIPQAPAYRDFLPQAVDLSKYFPPVGDQKMQGSCVAWATAYAARAYYAEQVEHRDTTAPQNQPSPAYVFDMIHIGNDCEQGAYIPDAMNLLQQGAYSLADFPYDDSKCPTPAPPERAKASDFKIGSYEQVWDINTPDLDKVKGALAKGEPVVVIALVDGAFQALSPKNKIWRSSGTQGDGHAFTLVGYDDRIQAFKFINSWNTVWGDNGYGWLSYDTMGAKVIQGFVMHMPGDPDITLDNDVFNPDQVDVKPVTPNFVPPLNVRPTSSRSLETNTAQVDLGNLACGKVDIGTDAEGNSVATGFVGTQAELDAVTTALKDKVESNQVILAPWPACEVRMTLAASLADTDVPLAVVDPASPKVGDAVRIGVQSPGYPSYLYAAYFAADGSVTNLLQPGASGLKAKPGHTQITFGNPDSGEMALTVSKPVGDEMLVVVASEKPLFDAARPDQETDRQFLSDLRTAVLAGDAGRVTATVLPVTTTE